MNPARRAKSRFGHAQLASALLLGLSLGAATSFWHLGQSMLNTVLGGAFSESVGQRNANAAPITAPGYPTLTSRGQAAIGTLARVSDKTVAAMRRFAAQIPQGQTKVFTFEGVSHTMSHIPNLEQLGEFFEARAPRTSPIQGHIAIAQRRNLVALLDQAYNEVLARGVIPGPGGMYSNEPPSSVFRAADVPWGVYAYADHGDNLSVGNLPLRDLDPSLLLPDFEANFVTNLRRTGHRGEPVILDVCASGSCATQPQSAARRIANRIDAPVIAPTQPSWITVSKTGGVIDYRGRFVGTQLDHDGWGIPSGDWVLVYPDAWGGQVIRGPKFIDD